MNDEEYFCFIMNINFRSTLYFGDFTTLFATNNIQSVFSQNMATNMLFFFILKLCLKPVISYIKFRINFLMFLYYLI